MDPAEPDLICVWKGEWMEAAGLLHGGSIEELKGLTEQAAWHICGDSDMKI